MRKLLVIFTFGLFAIGCATKDSVVYFQEPEELEGYENVMDYEPVIQKNDVLRINVSSIDQDLVRPFQRNSGGQLGGGLSSQNLSMSGYMVDSDGYIQFPVLGEVKVAGFTKKELQQKFQKEIRAYVTDAVVDIRILNFKVTVLGEVGSPGRVEVQDERITIPELFAEVGDINYNGKRENIVVIREVDGVKSIGRVDITDSDVFKNPYFYLKQNDVVYVEPNYGRMKSAGFFGSPGSILSLVSSVLGLILILTR